LFLGFIAEGAGTDYRQARIVTLATGAPIFRTPDGRPAAYNKPEYLINPIRIIREADLVPMGIENMGRGTNIRRQAIEMQQSSKSSLDVFRNWIDADAGKEKNFLARASSSAVQAVTEMVQKAQHALAQHSLTNDATW
jgi:hypothetical protein